MPLAKTYKIETERLIIRCYAPKDAILLKRAIDESLEHLRPWMPWAKHEPEPLAAKVERLRTFRGQFDLGRDYAFGIFNKAEDELIGSTGLHTRTGQQSREIGYWISAKHLKKGYALEAAKALTKIGFEIEQLERIEIRCATNNVRSQKIPKKLAYIHEATLKHRTIDSDGKKRDVMIWTMFREDYFNSTLKDVELKAFNIINEEIKPPTQNIEK